MMNYLVIRKVRLVIKNKALNHINTDVNYIKISANKLRTNSKKKIIIQMRTRAKKLRLK